MQPNNSQQFTEKAWQAIINTLEIAKASQQQQMESEHLLKSLLEQDNSIDNILIKAGMNLSEFCQEVDNYIQHQPKIGGKIDQVYLGRSIDTLLDRAEAIRAVWQNKFISIEHLVSALMEDDRIGRRLLITLNSNRSELMIVLKQLQDRSSNIMPEIPALPDQEIDNIDHTATKSKMPNKPLELELIDRKIIQLETELETLKAEQRALATKWQSDQDQIDDIETIKKEIDTINISIHQAERNYDLSLAAELKYGKLIQLQSKLETAEVKLVIQTIKKEIDTINIEIQQAERDYDLAHLSYLKYGKLANLHRELQTAEIKLAQSQIRAKPHSPGIAEIITQSAEIPVNQILEPAITGQSATDERAADIYTRLLRDRIIFLGSQIDSDLANLIVSQLLLLEAEDPEKDIYLYINSPGGSISAGMSIFDVMNQIRPDVCTVCMGFAAGMGAFLLSAGAKGKRMSLSTGRIVMTKPVGGTKGQATDIAIQAQEIGDLTAKLNNLLAQHTGQSLVTIDRDTDRHFDFNAEAAREYGLIDTIVDRGINQA
jgi:ATP-dependent Clp protease, protease subunit